MYLQKSQKTPDILYVPSLQEQCSTIQNISFTFLINSSVKTRWCFGIFEEDFQILVHSALGRRRQQTPLNIEQELLSVAFGRSICRYVLRLGIVYNLSRAKLIFSTKKFVKTQRRFFYDFQLTSFDRKTTIQTVKVGRFYFCNCVNLCCQ